MAYVLSVKQNPVSVKKNPVLLCEWQPIRLANYENWYTTRLGLRTIVIPYLLNDLPRCIHKAEPHLFADDTQIATASHDINEIVESLSDDLCNIASWLSASKLTLNKSKTEYVNWF